MKKMITHPSLEVNPGYFIVYHPSWDAEKQAAFFAAIWYCLHLPRTIADLQYLPPLVHQKSRDNEQSHRIGFICYETGDNSLLSDTLRARLPTLIIAPDDLLHWADTIARNIKVPIATTPFSALTNDSLKFHWHQISALCVRTPPLDLPAPSLGIRSNNGALLLALQFLGRQLCRSDNAPAPGVDPEWALLDAHVMLNALANFQAERSGFPLPASLSQFMQQNYDRELQKLRVPVVVWVPAHATADTDCGSSTKQRREHHPAWGTSSLEPLSTHDENDMRLISAAHRVLARQGVVLQLKEIPNDLSCLLWQLEDHCRRPNNRTVWRLLCRLGSRMAQLFDDNSSLMMPFAETITAFSNFPLGLAIPPGTSAPLQVLRPLWYRSLSPPAGAFLYEISNVPVVFLSGGFRILVAECLDETDPIHDISVKAWEDVGQQVSTLQGVEFELVHVGSSDELNAKLVAKDYDVLVISAHGVYDRSSNIAGIAIGKDVCLGTELENVPTLVIFSACHVMPRGGTVFSIADVLLEKGAHAVLGTLVPVHVQRNAALMGRLFCIIIASIRGDIEYKTLDRAWFGLSVTNIVVDILHASKGLWEWGLCHWEPISDMYTRWENEGLLRSAHIYEDTEKMLAEYARHTGMYETFKATMSSQSYFPETAFYMLLGRPDRIVFSDTFREDARKKVGMFDLLGRPK